MVKDGLPKSGVMLPLTMVRQRTGMASGLGGRLSQLRKARQMTQVELAKAIGVTQGVVSLYEQGSIEPSASVMVAIAKTLKASTDELLGLREAKTNERGKESLRLMRKLRRVEELPVKDRRHVLHLIDSLIEKQTLKRA